MSNLRLWILPFALLTATLLLVSRPGEAGKLAQDGRAGVVLEVQGTALVQPAGRERWTPLGPKSVLYPGDLLRTSARGAHALEFMTPRGTVLLGPGCELQIQEVGVRLLRGELEIQGRNGKALTLEAPGDYEQAIQGTAWVRAEGRTTRTLDKAPRWVEGYRSSASDEWMGSLLAKVDGRDVPLAVGYHKVGVEVRDQIARTTVEQSFINSTKGRLEGVFYFPLPADASISGFGMWIGGELVEADIVERQRARQIYEDILRRKKDPGLLEWEGGNIFKARVFPIEPHSEKRIRIRYTQVLPLEGDTYRYRYALRSELLRSKPLRELEIKVSVVSTQPMRKIGSPTHEITLHNTGAEATAEFRASEYSPKDDFELAVTIDRSGDVTAVPHVRGEDGYFMLLVAPPDRAAGAWKRELVPEGDPLNLILVADTSGSMDEAARKNQADFLGALFELLGTKDRFRLLACDATAEWLTDGPQAPESGDAALAALAKRRSLGWTDLDLALTTALKDAPEGALVIYVGDGVGTTGNADPNEQAERIRALGATTKASVHAVAASSSYEAGVLGAMARVGGGSFRTLRSRPAHDAAALLAEAARPTVRDMRVSIEGLRTARVYPAELPNLPLGSQQVVLGRFLPTGEPQSGQVVVTGTLDGKAVRYSADLSIGAGDSGNSFLPRLWGRKHIDALQASGSSAENNAEIVSFSERFGIMTPLTSFLVLESDEDRERYGVERRVRMRDGERFFAEAKDKAALEKKRDLMRAAGRWRLGLRRQMLLEIARLGRDLPIHTPPTPQLGLEVAVGEHLAFMSEHQDANGDGVQAEGGVPFGGGADRGLTVGRQLLRAQSKSGGSSADGGDWGAAPAEAAYDMETADAASAMPMNDARMPPPASAPAPVMAPKRARRSAARKLEAPSQDAGPEASLADDMDELMEEEIGGFDKKVSRRPSDGYFGQGLAGLRAEGGESLGKRLSYGGRHWQPAQFALQSLGFPWIPEPPRDDTGEDGTPWDDDVLALLRGLPRRAALRALAGPLHIQTRHTTLHPTRQAELDQAWMEAWIDKSGWRIRQAGAGFGEPTERWVHAGERGALAHARRLARTRKAEDADRDAFWLPLWDLQSRDVIRAWQRAGWRARIEKTDGDTVVVRLHRDAPDQTAMLLTVDSAKQVIRETRWLDTRGLPTGRIVRSDFVEAAGRWWARSIVRHDRKDRVVGRRTVFVEKMVADGLTTLAREAAEKTKDVLFVRGELPKAHVAKQALHEKRARFEDHLVLALTLGQQQRWEPALAAWADAAALAAGLPGTRWVQTEFDARARRGEAFKTWLLGLVPQATTAGGVSGTFLAHYIYNHASQVLGPTERLALLTRLARAWKGGDGPLADVRALILELLRAGALDEAGRSREARDVRAALAAKWPYRHDVQLAYEQDLWNTGRSEQALALLDDLLLKREPWLATERDALYNRLTDRLWERRQLGKLHTAIERWLGHKPEASWIWQRWYSSFYLLGRADDGDAAVKSALALRPEAGAHPSVWARQSAAVGLALGSGWHFDLNQLEAGWIPALEELVLYLTRLDAPEATSAGPIFHNWRFRRTQAYRRVREALYADIGKDGAIAALPLPRLARYISWLSWGRNQADDTLWQAVLDRLKARWTQAQDAGTRVQVGDHVLTLLDARGLREDAIAFARERYAHAAKTQANDRALRASQLFDRLLGTPDRDEHATAEREDECFALLNPRLDPRQDVEAQRAEMARAVRRLADRVYRWRYEAGLGTPEERKDLTRAALKTLQKEVRKKVRGTLAERFQKAENAGNELADPWFALERLGYRAQHGEGQAAVVEEALRRLAASTVREDLPLQRLYRERLAVIATYAVTRQNTPDELVGSVLQLFAEGDAAEVAARAADAEAIELLDWRYQIYRLLVARDDVPTLTKALDDWIVPAKVESRWRVARGYIHAELGDLPSAIAQFEEVQKLDELAAGDYRALADWYLVTNDDARRGVALERYYGYQNEWQLSNLAWQLGNKRGPSGVPGDFDPETLRVLEALFRKARYPANYWWRQRDLYRATKDHRILASMGEALTGHTREATYGYLGRITQIMGQVHEEATLDEVQKHLGELVRASTKPLDRRALKLAISLAAGRASQVKVKDPAHGAKALAMLQDAFQETWQEGEPRLMAEFLRGLGAVQDAAVKQEQLRQIEALRARAKAASMERLWITDALAQTHWGYGDHDRALEVLAAGLAEIRTTHAGLVPMDAVRVFDRYVNWLSNRGRFADAERYILAEIERWDLPLRRRGLRSMLYKQYVEAVRRGGSVSLGRGTALFGAAASAMEATMLADPAYASNTLGTFCDLHRRAQEVSAPRNAGKLLLVYAKERMPALLERLPINGTSHATTVAAMVRTLEGPRTGLTLLLDRRDTEPRWLERIGYDVWQQTVYNFARWRSEAGSIGDLEPRLEKLVISQLERNLALGGNHGSYFWNLRNKWAWREKADAFAATAERVAELNESSLAVILRCANHLRSGLRRLSAATAMLQQANGRGLLDLNARWTLTTWLVQGRRYDEALPLAEALVKEKADNLGYRLKLVEVHAGLKRTDDVAATLDAAETHFRESKRWNENVAARLGETAAANRMPARAERWLEEAIRLRQEARGNRGGRDSTLSRYYRSLAKARGELGKTVAAVQAASTAILSANVRNQREFSAAIKSLDDALASARELEAYVETYEAEVAESGLDAPVLRKALARAFAKRGDHKAAVHHLLAARELEPGDGDVHKELVAAYDQLGDATGAIDALFGSIRLAPHALDAYRALAERYAKAGDEQGAERAHTTLVEASPHQAAGHQALAGLRESQERWPEAVVQWQQVVRTERLDPTGWLSLARGLMRTGDAAAARKALDHVLTNQWESRFGDVKAEAARLMSQLKQ